MPFPAKKLAVGLAIGVIVAVPILFLRRPAPAVDRDTSLALNYMRSDLRALITLEEGTRRATTRYTADPEIAGHLSTVGVNRPVISVKGDGWTAVVTHRNITGIQCAVAVNARNPMKFFAKDGEIVCR